MRISLIRAAISSMVVAACVPAVADHAAENHDVSGRVHGLWDGADGVVLRLQADGVDALHTVSSNGAFGFDAALAAGSSYVVTVAGSPSQHDCVIEHGGAGVVANASAPSVSVACKGPDVAIAFSGAWGWSFDPTQEIQTFSGPVAAQDVALTLSGAAAMQASLDGAALALGQPSARLSLPLGSRIVPVSFATSGGLSKTYQLVFERATSVLAQVAYVKASNPDTGDHFGWSISLSGNTLAVGATAEDSAATGINGNQADNTRSAAGAVYVFVNDGTTWSQQAYIKASNPDPSDLFGIGVSLSGNTLAVGAPGESSRSATDQSSNLSVGSGAVYVFVRNGTTWSQQAYLKASNIGANDAFGTAVGLSGDTLAVGAPSEASSARGINGSQGNNAAERAGAVYVFQRSGTQWTQQAYIKASNTQAGDGLGSLLALSGDTLAVAALGEDSNATGVNGNQNDNSEFDSGAVYVYQRTGQTWAQQAYVKASNTRSGMEFGCSIALSGDTLAVGANHEDPGTVSGAVYVFVRSAAQWTQQAFLKASNAGVADFFGDSLAISGDRLLVGATGEASIATGVNGDQTNNTAGKAGAAYLFERSGGVWTQQAYLKASNTRKAITDRFDRQINGFFGLSVAVSETTVVVGAALEFGGSPGINGDQTDISKQQAGALYIFQQ